MPAKRTAFIAVLLASVAGQAAAARAGHITMSYFAAIAFVLAGLQYAFTLNRSWWADSGRGIEPARDTAQPVMAARNAEAIGLCYGWGGLSLLAVYQLSGVHWQHGWQYGLGMVAIAALVMAAARLLRGASWTRAHYRALGWASAAHGLAALAGVAWLIGSGKAQSLKGDWAANVVFLMGGLLIAGVTVMGLKTAMRLEAGGSKQPV